MLNLNLVKELIIEFYPSTTLFLDEQILQYQVQLRQ